MPLLPCPPNPGMNPKGVTKGPVITSIGERQHGHTSQGSSRKQGDEQSSTKGLLAKKQAVFLAPLGFPCLPVFPVSPAAARGLGTQGCAHSAEQFGTRIGRRAVESKLCDLLEAEGPVLISTHTLGQEVISPLKCSYFY